jgi:hypothetical protein
MVFSLLTIAYFAAWLRALDRHSSPLPQPDGARARQDPGS